jgi:hypothetical protein
MQREAWQDGLKTVMGEVYGCLPGLLSGIPNMSFRPQDKVAEVGCLGKCKRLDERDSVSEAGRTTSFGRPRHGVRA